MTASGRKAVGEHNELALTDDLQANSCADLPVKENSKLNFRIHRDNLERESSFTLQLISAAETAEKLMANTLFLSRILLAPYTYTRLRNLYLFSGAE